MTDYSALDKELDKVKSQIFLNNNAAFYGSVLCSLSFVWDESVKTAGTDGISIYWCPNFFKSLKPTTRKTVLVHEIRHVAHLHELRRQNRNEEIWNYACDIRLNNDLENDGYSFEGIEWVWKDHSFDKYEKMCEEDIYDELMKKATPIPSSGAWGQNDGGDLKPTPKDKKQTVVNTVVRAIQQAKILNGAGSVPGNLEQIIESFLKPIIPWERALMEFFTDMFEEDYSWRRPNRRYKDVYMPSLIEMDEGRLDYLAYFIDVSGSITDSEIHRFNSEVKYIQTMLKPKRLSLIQFDTQIQKVDEFTEDDAFKKIQVIGRGGTDLDCVHEYIEKHKPTAVVVFSDLRCRPMQPLRSKIPVLWVVTNSGRTPPYGKMIRITT